MSDEFLIDITLPGNLERGQIEHPENRVWQGVAQKITGILLLGERGVKKFVVGMVDLAHTPYNGEIELIASKWSRIKRLQGTVRCPCYRAIDFFGAGYSGI